MTPETLSEQRIIDAFASRARRAQAGAGCPDPDTVWRAVRMELPHPRTREIGLHAATCPACAEAWRLAREIAGEAPADVLPFARPQRAGARALRRWVGGALAAAAAVVLLAVLLPSRPVPLRGADSPLRGGPEPIRALNDLSVPLARGRCELRWGGPANARWDVRVATEELRVIAEAHDLGVTTYVVPEAALAGLAPGSRIIWQVQALLPDGRRIVSRSFVQTLE